MAPTWIESDSNTNKDISSAASVGVYTSTGDKFVLPQLLADQVAGNGDYVYYVTLQVAGAGSHYVIGPKTTHTAASGETAIGAQGGFIAVRSGDVLTVYVDGLAGDTATPDVVVRWFELDASANVTTWKGTAVADLQSGGRVDAWASTIGNDAISSDTFDEVTAFALRSADRAVLNSLAGMVETGGSGESTYERYTAAALEQAGLRAPVGTAADGSVMDYLAEIAAVTDTLDVSAVTQVAASSAGHLTITAGLTFDEPVTGLTIPADWAAALWTLKRSPGQADTAAVIQLRVSNPADGDDGLQRLNGAAVAAPITAASGTLTVTQATGRIDVFLTDELTALLSKATGLGWDVKFIDDAGDSVGRRGTADVVLTETRAVV